MLRQFSDKGAVDFVSFASSLNEKINDPRYFEAFGDAFDLLDTGMKGELTKDDLIFGMQKLGENLTPDEAEEMLKIAAKVGVVCSSMSQRSQTTFHGVWIGTCILLVGATRLSRPCCPCRRMISSR